MRVPFSLRAYIAWIAAIAAAIWITSITIWWVIFPLFGLIVFVTIFVRCNVCGHHVAADARGHGRFLRSTCAKCDSSLEGVYPFSFLKHRRTG